MLLTRNRFIVQQDTPSSYSGQTGLVPRVNAAEDALEFVAAAAGVDISCRVFHSVEQSIANNTVTILTWDSESFDTDGMHDPAVNPSRITIQTAGKYLVWASLDWRPAFTGVRQVALRVNGVTFEAFDSRFPTPEGDTMQTALKVLDLAVGDYIEARAFQTSGGALGVAEVLNSTLFGAIKILG